MHEIRTRIHEYISKPVLFILIGLSLVGLSLMSQSFLLSTTATLASLDSEFISPPISSLPSSQVLGASTESTIPPSSLKVPGRDITLGEEGSDVIALQEFLRWRGLWPEGEEISGYFGTITLEMVKAYQELNGIEAEGDVGPLTRDAWSHDLTILTPSLVN